MISRNVLPNFLSYSNETEKKNCASAKIILLNKNGNNHNNNKNYIYLKDFTYHLLKYFSSNYNSLKAIFCSSFAVLYRFYIYLKIKKKIYPYGEKYFAKVYFNYRIQFEFPNIKIPLLL